MKRPTTSVAIGTLVLFIAAAPVFAQSGPGKGNGPGNGAGQGRGPGPHHGPPPGGNHSDDTGPGHGKDNMGGGHGNNGNGNDNGKGVGNGKGNSSGKGGMAAAILNAQGQVMSALTSSNVSFVTASMGGTTHTAAVASVASLLAGEPGAVGPAAEVTNAFSSSGASPAQLAALVRSVAGLGTMPVHVGDKAAEARIRTAAVNFNAFVKAASPEFLASPPAEFLVLRGTLAPLVRALDLNNSGLLATLAP